MRHGDGTERWPRKEPERHIRQSGLIRGLHVWLGEAHQPARLIESQAPGSLGISHRFNLENEGLGHQLQSLVPEPLPTALRGYGEVLNIGDASQSPITQNPHKAIFIRQVQAVKRSITQSGSMVLCGTPLTGRKGGSYNCHHSLARGWAKAWMRVTVISV